MGDFRRIILLYQSIGASKIFKVTIQNFGKLTDAVVRIGKFTVFAGPNNTGKSFVSKALYSIFGAANANHLALSLDGPMTALRSAIREIKEREFQSEALTKFAEAVEKLRDLIGNIPYGKGADELLAIDDMMSSLLQITHEIDSAYTELYSQLKQWEDECDSKTPGIRDRGYDLDDMTLCVDVLASIKDTEPMEHVRLGVEKQVKKNLLGNFQATGLSYLCRGSDAPAGFFIEGVGNFGFEGEKIIIKGLSPQGFRAMRRSSEVFYLESPAFWRLQNSLESTVSMLDRLLSREHVHAPKYFYDMLDAIKGNRPQDLSCIDLLGHIIAEIGGRILVDSSTNNLFFSEEGGRDHPLSRTAAGVTNFGMLGLLLNKQLLDKNSFLFVDEPEAHLHPAWQVAMTKVLIHLAERGVNVVIATHSADILKWLQVHAKENPDAEEIIALNHFQKGGTVESDDDFLETLSGMQDDLTAPYQDMFIRGLRA